MPARFKGRGVLCRVSSGAYAYRPNKTAAGMSNTFRRHKRGHSDVAHMLSVRGTLDTLSRWYWNITTCYDEARCVHCGATYPTRLGRCRLSNAGKIRLLHLRAKRAARPESECTCRPSGYHGGHANYCPCNGEVSA